jgi:gluconolactonase
MTRFVLAVLLAAIAGMSLAAAQAPAPAGGVPFRIEKLDPSLDDIIDPAAKLETLGDRFTLTEGPVWVPEGQGGYLLFSENAGNVIYKWQEGKPLSVFLEKSGFTGTDISKVGAQTVAGRIPILLVGSNGLALDPNGRLVVLAMNDRTVYRLEADGKRTVLADRWEGKRFNGPNDIVIKSNGSIYFTDTPWGLRESEKDPQREIPFHGFYLVKDGKVTLLGSDAAEHGGIPNGITLSPDEKYLYVTAARRGTLRYDINPDDTVSNGKVFVNHGGDGMRVDRKGNLYTTGGGGGPNIQITSPEGKPLGRLLLPQPAGEPRTRVCATNVAFGDNDDRTLFITACTHLFKIRLKQPGVRPGRKP